LDGMTWSAFTLLWKMKGKESEGEETCQKKTGKGLCGISLKIVDGFDRGRTYLLGVSRKGQRIKPPARWLSAIKNGNKSNSANERPVFVESRTSAPAFRDMKRQKIFGK